MSANKDYVGKFAKAMYGTRDGPAVWREEVRARLISLGVTQSRINPCVCFHSVRDLRIIMIMLMVVKLLVRKKNYDG